MISILYSQEQKNNYILDFIENRESMLFIIDMQGIDNRGIGGDVWSSSGYIRTPHNFQGGLVHKESYINLDKACIKVVVHVNSWNERWVEIGQELGVKTVIFRKPIE